MTMTGAAVRRKALQLEKSTEFSHSLLARKGDINRTTLSLFLKGHIELREDQLAAIDRAVEAVARQRLQSLRALLSVAESYPN
jgi:hypothetical protein